MITLEIPGYLIIQPIKSGGMSTVYLAEQTSLDRKVAIKVMGDHLSQDDSFSERFEQEAKIASRLAHPNIVTIFDYGSITSNVNGRTLYLVMAYIEGQDLKSLQPKLSLVTRLKIIQDIANALSYAHKQGIVHRDIKPQNILVEKDESRALLTDFGIAKAKLNSQELTQTGMTLGTPHYMSPEQAQGKALDQRADIYSLGVVLFFLLTGQIPYDGDSDIAIGIKHLTDPIPQLPKIFQCFQAIVDKSLAKDPEERYQTASEFAEAIGRVSIDNLATLVQSIKDESEAQTQLVKAIPNRTAKKSSATQNKSYYNATVLVSSAIISFALVFGLSLLVKDWLTGAKANDSIKKPSVSQSNESPTKTAQQNTAAKLNCNYELIDDWGTGWQGKISLTNHNPYLVENWNVQFKQPEDFQITSSFVTQLRDNKGSITFTPHNWNNQIKSKATLELGFQGKGIAPSQLNDLHCSLM